MSFRIVLDTEVDPQNKEVLRLNYAGRKAALIDDEGNLFPLVVEAGASNCQMAGDTLKGIGLLPVVVKVQLAGEAGNLVFYVFSVGKLETSTKS